MTKHRGAIRSGIQVKGYTDAPETADAPDLLHLA
jgi:hypothetical protein